jgi:DNA-binding transcriptional ArsR family regulator
VGPRGVLKVPTNLEEGTTLELKIQDDGSIMLSPIETEEEAIDDEEQETGYESFLHDGVETDDEAMDHEEIVLPRPAGATVSPDTRELTEMMRVVADPTRMSIIKGLRDGERNVGELCNDVRMSQPAVSHHLKLLRMTHVVEPRRDGKRIFYSLTAQGRCLIENVSNVVL